MYQFSLFKIKTQAYYVTSEVQIIRVTLDFGYSFGEIFSFLKAFPFN